MHRSARLGARLVAVGAMLASGIVAPVAASASASPVPTAASPAVASPAPSAPGASTSGASGTASSSSSGTTGEPARTRSVRVAGRVDPAAARDTSALQPAQGETASSAGATARATTGPRLAVLSPPTRTGEFLVAGVTWARGSQDVVDAAVRVREGGRWGAWTPVHVDDAGVPGERPGTEPVVTSGADGVQVRIVTADGTAPADVRVDVVNPGTGPAPAASAATAPSATSAQAAPDATRDLSGLGTAAAASGTRTATGDEIRPTVVTRAGWGADERRASAWPTVSARVQALYVHNTAGTNTYTRSQSAAIVRGIYAYHTGSRGWPDIGYQFLVDRFGTVYEGRRDAIHDAPVGAQAGGYNTGTIGVAGMGNFDTGRPTAALVAGIERVLAWQAYRYGLDATGRTTLVTGASSGTGTRAKAGTKVRVPVILGHRHTNVTSCPGTHLAAKLPAIRTDVKKRVAAARARYGKVTPALRAPVAVPAAATVVPAQWSSSARFSWKPVPGAVRYQVLTRDSAKGSWAPLDDTRAWERYATVTGTSAAVSTSAGVTRLVAVRAVDAKGRLGAIAVHSQVTRRVSDGAVHRSGSWRSVGLAGAYGGTVWRSTSPTATMRVTVTAARQVVLLAATGPRDGRIEVRQGTKRLGVLSLATPTEQPRTTVVLPLATPVTGRLTLVALDGRPKRVSELAFPRTRAARGVGVVSAARAATPTTVPLPAADAVRYAGSTTVRWKPAARATRYEVWVRTAAHGARFGAWTWVATTTATRHRLATASNGTTWDVAVRAVGEGGSSAFAHWRTVTRPVATSTVRASIGWRVRTDTRYVRDRAWVATATGRTLTVARGVGVTRVRVLGRTGPGQGRLGVWVGGSRVGTVSLAASRTTWAGSVEVVLRAPRSGTVVLKTLDGRPVRVSAVGLGRS